MQNRELGRSPVIRRDQAGLSRPLRRDVLDLLAEEAESRYGVGEHGSRVADLARAIAVATGRIAPDHARRAGLLHDIGKALLPFHPGDLGRRLTPGEVSVVRSHARLGAKAALWAGEDEEVVEAVLYHHERFDGSGYPVGLRGFAVPLLAQAVAAADVYDALTTSRSYKREWPAHVVEAYFSVNRGRLFHPVVVDGLIEVAPEFNAVPPASRTARRPHH